MLCLGIAAMRMSPRPSFLTPSRDIFRRKNPACKLPLGGKETLEDAPYTR
jgi:hypothetical protein